MIYVYNLEEKKIEENLNSDGAQPCLFFLLSH